MKNQNLQLKTTFLFWLPFAAICVIFCGALYTSVQHALRTAANDPQIQMQEDTAAQLNSGASPQTLIKNTGLIDISTSLAPYIIIFNDQGQPLASNAKLLNKMPQLPAGVFSFVARYGQDRLTWQPLPGVRSAVVVGSYNNEASGQSGFVLAGRSLREVEKRENDIFLISCFACIASLAATFLAAAYAVMRRPEK
jgi:hypothetical protein